MADRTKLTPEAIRRELAGLPGWRAEDDKLLRSYRFESFARAFAFMAGSAVDAQALNHHPEWSNVFDKVEVTLWTHDRGGVTALDVELAQRMEKLAARLGEA